MTTITKRAIGYIVLVWVAVFALSYLFREGCYVRMTKLKKYSIYLGENDAIQVDTFFRHTGDSCISFYTGEGSSLSVCSGYRIVEN